MAVPVRYAASVPTEAAPIPSLRAFKQPPTNVDCGEGPWGVGAEKVGGDGRDSNGQAR